MENRPPLPTEQLIPKALIEQWLDIPASDEVHIALTRADLDSLFFAINHAITAQSQLQEAVIRYSNGELDHANMQMDLSKRSNIEATNSLRSLFGSIFASAAKSRSAKR